MAQARTRPGSGWLWTAAALGALHAAVSVYWGLGGRVLRETIGQQMLQAFAGLEGLLVLVGAAKLAAAMAPAALDAAGWPLRRLTRPAAWAGAAALVLWGGANTVVGNLVLAEVIVPDSGYDRPAMIGHAWLWDPLFLAWGGCLIVGLLRSRRARAR